MDRLNRINPQANTMKRPRPVDVVVLVAVIAFMVVNGYFGWIGLAIVE